ncbi:hypothetical protein C2S52_020369 [Perilla frutescens var. hirtella]|nr:hypothetical protein C2S52_020369 [Perilla frutescens var. hirtella]
MADEKNSTSKAGILEQSVTQLKEQFFKQYEQYDVQTVAQNKKYQEVVDTMADLHLMMKSLTQTVIGNSHGENSRGSTSTPSQHYIETGNSTNRSNSLRLDLPKFDGTDPNGWVFRIQEYIDFHETPNEQGLRIVAFNLEGKALDWYQWMKINERLSTWSDFLIQLKERFGPSQFEDNFGKLSKLRQKSSVIEYQTEFEALMNKVAGVTDNFLILMFTSGLRKDIQRPLRGSSDSLALGNSGSQKGQPIKTTKPGIPFHRLTQAEMQENQSKGVCFNCDQRWAVNHRCARKVMLLISTDDEEFDQNEEEDKEEEPLILDDASSLHALAGPEGPDIVLGVPWLQSLGKVTHDYAQMTMEFKWKKRRTVLQRIESLSPRKITFNQFQAMIEKNGVHSIYELVMLTEKKELLPQSDENEFSPDLPDTIREVLKAHKAIFQSPKGLQPQCDIGVEPISLPVAFHEGQPVLLPMAILSSKMVLRHRVPKTHVLIQWQGLPPEDASWELLDTIQDEFPDIHLEDKVLSKEEGDDTLDNLEDVGVMEECVRSTEEIPLRRSKCSGKVSTRLHGFQLG